MTAAPDMRKAINDLSAGISDNLAATFVLRMQRWRRHDIASSDGIHCRGSLFDWGAPAETHIYLRPSEWLSKMAHKNE